MNTFQLTDEERRRHIYLSGKSGTGKTSLLKTLILSDISHGRGFCLLDPHGDLAVEIANSIPEARINDTIYLDPQDPYALGFNPLENVPEGKRAIATASIVTAFKDIWSDNWGPRLEYILGQSVRLLMDTPETTLLHLPQVLLNADYREKLLKNATDPFNRYYWKYEVPAPKEWFQHIAAVQNKVGAFAGNPYIRAILGQQTTIHTDRIMNEGKLLICNLSKSMGTEPSHLLGALLATSFFQAAERRITIPESERRDFTLYVDEFQNFSSESFASILSEARKWRLNLVIANQFMTQLSENLQQAVLGNVGTLVSFRVGSKDAVVLAQELGLKNPDELMDLPNFRARLRQVEENIPGSAKILSLPAPGDTTTGSLKSVQSRTRFNYTRPREAVEAKIARFYGT